MTHTAISLENITKKYCLYRRRIHRVMETFHPARKIYHRPFYALQDFNLDVRINESVGIIGRNGSGKSTLLQLICGILSPTAGNLQINGRVSALLELGAGFNPEFTGRENVYLNTSIMGLTKEETDAKFDHIAEFADIGDFIDRPVKMYSSGMYVRLAFATAISIEPDILIVDEALAVGDIFFQQKCVKHMKEMIKSCTIIVVSHDMHAVSNLCDRVVLIEGGKKVFDGQTAEGIALYTRLVHDELFDRRESFRPAQDNLPEDIIKKIHTREPDVDEWPYIDAESLGGGGDVSIHKASMTKNGEVFKTIEKGEIVTVRMLVHAKRLLEEVIFGYTVKDRVGVALFGENSVSLLDKPLSLKAGFSVVTFQFEWPEVCAQEYTLTLGIGEGDHPFDHTVQCWAHNIFSVAAITPGEYFHGIFNNPLKQISVDQIS